VWCNLDCDENELHAPSPPSAAHKLLTVGMQQFLIDLLWFNVVHYSSLVQYFFRSTMVPTLVENPNSLVYLLEYFVGVWLLIEPTLSQVPH